MTLGSKASHPFPEENEERKEQCLKHKQTKSFSITDQRFASCSDDASVKIWDFEKCTEERTLTGHGSDVKCCDWHPFSSLIASGSKDSLVKLWDARSATSVQTL